MSESIEIPALGTLYGIAIIPSAHIPQGYRRTQWDTVYIHPATYALLKPMSATDTLFALGRLREVGESDIGWRAIEPPSGGSAWGKLDEALKTLNELMEGQAE